MKSNFVPAPRKLQSQTEDEAPKCYLHSHPEVGKNMPTHVCNWWSDTSIWNIHHEMNRGLHVYQPTKYTHKIHLIRASVSFLNWCPQIGAYSWSAHLTWASCNLPEILLYIMEIAKTSTREEYRPLLSYATAIPKTIETFQKCLCNQWSNWVPLRCCCGDLLNQEILWWWLPLSSAKPCWEEKGDGHIYCMQVESPDVKLTSDCMTADSGSLDSTIKSHCIAMETPTFNLHDVLPKVDQR